MSKNAFVRRACADLGITMFELSVPDNANATQAMDALIEALEKEYGKED